MKIDLQSDHIIYQLPYKKLHQPKKKNTITDVNQKHVIGRTIHFNNNSVMHNLACGGAAEQLNTESPTDYS